jgi:hypothetical protein
MILLGEIEAVSEAAPLDAAKWLSLIDSHESLGHVPSKMGINPFTKKPTEYKSPASTARICVEGASVGSIGWALDGSLSLIVEAEENSVDLVTKTAEEVARTLGGRFVLSRPGR